MEHTRAQVLADRIYSGEGIAADAARIVAANILLALCAHIAVPLPWTPVPWTGQTFGVLLVGVMLGARRGAIALGMYLLEGLAGLPVFQPFGAPGAARLAGPTAGFLWAYPAAAFVAGWLVERGASLARGTRAAARLVGALVAGEAVIFAGGCAWLALMMGLGWPAALAQGALPFVGGEIAKIALIVAAVRGVELARREA